MPEDPVDIPIVGENFPEAEQGVDARRLVGDEDLTQVEDVSLNGHGGQSAGERIQAFFLPALPLINLIPFFLVIVFVIRVLC